jgi:hypothetical protein
MAAESRPNAVARWLANPDLPLRLSLLLLLLAPVGSWELRPFVRLVAAGGLLSGVAARSPWTWLALTGLTGWRVVADWPLADNHAYLLAYWCLAVLLSQLVPDPAAALGVSGRLLVGLAFAFATLWKLVLSPDYLDGTFFRVWLLVDPRFEDLARLVGGLSPAELDASRTFLQPPPTLGVEHYPALVEPAALRRGAECLTFAALALEGLLAVLFLAPVPARRPWLRHAPLLAFCAATYAVAPVVGFGWLLLAMGLAGVPGDALRLRLVYLACFALLLLHDSIPWAGLALGHGAAPGP